MQWSVLGALLTPASEPPRFILSRWLFLRLLALVYFLAFASLAPQILGLIGSDGLLPIAHHLDAAREVWGADAYYRLPTLAWISASDGALVALCWIGMALAALAAVGLAPIVTFGALWITYLSLTVAGQDFLQFQWDILLLETGLLGLLYAPLGLRPRLATARQPLTAVRWLIWGLAFKLTFLSGLTKLTSGDATWWSLSALGYHYETQPLPTWTSWYAHNLPDWFGMLSVGVMFVIELALPFLVFVPSRYRRVRAAACAGLCLLQILIAATGNYGFFNVLTLALYLSLLDDAVVRRVIPRWLLRADPAALRGPQVPEPRRWRIAVAVVALPLALLSALTVVREVSHQTPLPTLANAMLGWVAPARAINGYGLFRTMTTDRPEIVIEGSVDGTTWTEYALRWKPGDLARRPRFVQPHMPRLDWQMWFAALGPRQHAHWLIPLAEHLLDGSPAVRALLDEDAFEEAPPRFVRFVLYRYHFTTPAEAEDGDWWRRDFLAYLTEPISADSSQ